MIGNKCDLEARREVTYEEASAFAEENGLPFMEVLWNTTTLTHTRRERERERVCVGVGVGV